MAKSKPIEVDILDMELSKGLPHWLDPIERYKGAHDNARKQKHEAHIAKLKAQLQNDGRKKQWQQTRDEARRRLLQFGQNGLYRGWNEAEHPREPAGSSEGGQFAGGAGSGGAEQPHAMGPGDSAAGHGQLPRAFSRESPGGIDRGRNVVSVYRPTGQAAAEITARGHAPLTFHELGGAEGAKAFQSAITAAKTGPYGAAVTAHSVDDYRGMRLFMTPDGKCGFALNGDDIVSVFKHPDIKIKGVATTSLMLATEQGGRRLDCFDTALPSLYDKSGFRAVARLKWSEQHKPPGWVYDTYKEHNNGRPDVVFMVHDPATAKPYVKGDGGYVKDYDQGTAVQLKSEPSIRGYNPGVRGRGKVEVELRRQEWVAQSPIRTVDDVIRAAPIAQKSFADAGRQIAAELGIEFKDPGPKTKTAKGIERIEQKIARRNGVTAQVTDTARGAFVIDNPELADEIIHKLARTHEVVAEPWRTIPESHYTDRALLFRDRVTGLIGEVQIMDPKMWTAKNDNGGHELYEQARKLPKGPELDKLEAQMRALYDPILDSYSGAWKAVDGRGGVFGNS